jgi:hypothetical protein
MYSIRKNKINTVIFSVIFPSNFIFFNEFMRSLDMQIYKDFLLLLLNDGVDSELLKLIISQYSVQVKIEDVSIGLSPSEIREHGIAQIISLGYENVIFADTDDKMSINRVFHSIHLLQKYPIICNDLSLIDEKDCIIKQSIWKDRISNGELKHTFINDKNILGLGNSSIRLEFLFSQLIPINIKAIDWFLFTKWLQTNTFFFTSDCQTLYRQHTNNAIGLKKPISLDRLHYIIEVKREHYFQFSDLGRKLSNELHSIDEKLYFDENFANKSISYLQSLDINFFWWEETNYLNKI